MSDKPYFDGPAVTRANAKIMVEETRTVYPDGGGEPEVTKRVYEVDLNDPSTSTRTD